MKKSHYCLLAAATFSVYTIPAWSAPVHFTCESRNPHVRPMYWQTVQGDLDTQGTPWNVSIIRTMTGRTENSCHQGKVASFEPGDPSSGTFLRYDVTGDPRDSGNQYFLLLPKSVLQASGSFSAILDTEFEGGRSGWWRSHLNCSK